MANINLIYKMKSISNQILAYILISLSIVFVARYFYTVHNRAQFETERLKKMDVGTCERLSYFVADPIMHHNIDLLKKNIGIEALDENIGSIQVLDQNNQLLGGVMRIKNSLRDINGKQLLVLHEDSIVRPVLYQGKKIGKVILYPNKEPLRQFMGEFKRILLLELSVFFLIIAIMLFLVLKMVVVNPLSTLKDWVSSINTDSSIPGPKLLHSTEVDTIIDSVSQLTNRLISSHKDSLDKSNQISENESLMTSISTNLPEGMIYRLVTGDKGYRKFTYLSGSFQKIYGHTPEEGMADPLLVFGRIAKEDIKSLLDAEAESKIKLSTFRCEVRMVNPDGTIRVSRFVSTPTILENGFISWDGMELDITALKKAQTDLQQSRFLLESITEGLPDSVFAKDTNGRFLFVNSALAKRANKSPEELLGKDNSFIFPLDEANKTMEKDLEIMKSGKTQTFEEQLTTPSGRVVNLTTKGPIKDAQGKTVGLFGIARNITDLKKAQADLKKNQFLMQSITDGLPDSIFAKDLNGNFTFVNSALTKHFNKSVEELLGNNIGTVFAPEISNARMAMDVEIIKDGKTRTFEELEATPSGDIVYLATKGAIKDEQGNIIGLFGINRDITALKKVQEELQQFQILMKSITDGLPDLIFAKDLDGRYLFVNSAVAKRADKKPEELLGKDNSIIFSTEEAKETRAMDLEVMESGKIRTFEEQLTTTLGKDIYLTTKGPLKDAQGKTIGLFGISHDITKRKRDEEALRVSQDKFAFAFNSSPNAILIQDIPTGKYTEANVTNEKIFGYSQEQFIGKSSLELNLYQDPKVRERVVKVLNEQGYIRNMEILCRHKSGEDLHILLTVERHYVDNNPFLYINAQDVTERKRVELELQKLNLDKDRFISILGHDLRGPVNNILALLDLLRTDLSNMEMEEMEEIVDVSYLSAQKTAKLLEDVLLWATAQSGKMKFDPQITNFKVDCLGIIELFQFNADAKNITIELHCEDSLEVYGDKNMLGTVLRNLLSNALKFTREGGKITISGEKGTKEIVVSIADNGVGIAPKDIDKIFDRTQLFTSIGTNEEEGTGFGLKLCREFVEKHGGKIWVESELGKGTTFYFSLPDTI